MNLVLLLDSRIATVMADLVTVFLLGEVQENSAKN